MIIIGCDYHPGFQQIAFVDTDSGELQERRLQHCEEAEKFYRNLAAQGMKVRVGMLPGDPAEPYLSQGRFIYGCVPVAASLPMTLLATTR